MAFSKVSREEIEEQLVAPLRRLDASDENARRRYVVSVAAFLQREVMGVNSGAFAQQIDKLVAADNVDRAIKLLYALDGTTRSLGGMFRKLRG